MVNNLVIYTHRLLFGDYRTVSGKIGVGETTKKEIGGWGRLCGWRWIGSWGNEVACEKVHTVWESH
jgi:hypothetical protein